MLSERDSFSTVIKTTALILVRFLFPLS